MTDAQTLLNRAVERIRGRLAERARPKPFVCDHCKTRRPSLWREEQGREWWFCPECWNERGIR